MDLPSTRDKTNYWQHQQDVNQSKKSHLKVNVEPQNTSHYSGNVQFYEENNQFKRSASTSDQCGSPFKKRRFTPQITPPAHTDEDDDDDDDDEGDSNTGTIPSKIKKDDSRRRAAHTAAEQKRRNAIRKGYDSLQSLVPNSHLLDPISSQKVSKAAILKRSTDYLMQLNKEKQHLNNQLEAKRKDTFCLRAVQKTYEDILEMNMNISSNSMEKDSRTKRDDSRRRAAHTAAEQKRRNAIRKGYDPLQSLVPNSHLLDPISSQKVSKAAILKRSTDYLIDLNKEKQELSMQLEAKKKDNFCLRAVQKTYEDILEMNMTSNKNASATINDEHKFKVFQNIADALFISFDQAMQSGQVINFSQFTSSILRWIEDSCRPSDINDIIRRVITNFKS